MLQNITPEQLATAPPGLVLDVRTPLEHAEKHLARAHIHVPLDGLNPEQVLRENSIAPDAPIYILCRSGKRAAIAAEKFRALGHHAVCVIAGGLEACAACGESLSGYATTQTAQGVARPPLSLERQVRIAAGAITAFGALLALTLDPAFALIPLATGSGLIFAGVTDRCGMALVLTKAPWNTRPKPQLNKGV